MADFIDRNDTLVTARLTINPTTFSDADLHYYLEASNEHGRMEYNFNLALTPPPTQPPFYDDKSSGDGDKNEANVGTIVGIVLGVLLILIAIALCVLYFYKQKWAQKY